MMKISKRYQFCAAHHLPPTLVGPDHKCSRQHGHTYQVTVLLRTEDSGAPWVCDYADIDKAMKPVLATLDHTNLNDVMMDPPTAEAIARFIFGRITVLPDLHEVTVHESPTTTATFRP